jgi:hypothetical protein
VKPTDTQIGGTHYKDMPIQPIDFITKNNIPYIEGNIIKYLCRWKSKNGVEDLKKAKHYLEMLIDIETPKSDPIHDAIIDALQSHDTGWKTNIDLKVPDNWTDMLKADIKKAHARKPAKMATKKK